MSWQPQQQGLRELLFLLTEAADPNSREQALVNQRLQLFDTYPDYNAYLIHILTKMTTKDANIRKLAGLQLKNNMKNNFNSIPLSVLEYIKQCCIDALDKPEPDIHKAVSGIIATIIRRGQVHNWSEIIFYLNEKLDNRNPLVVQTSFDTLAMICEDAAPELDQEMTHGARPLSCLIPKFVQFYSNPNPHLRVQAINATSQFVLLGPVSFVQQLDSILAALYQRASDENPCVRHEFGRILTLILEAFPEKIKPYLDSTIQHMISALSDSDTNVALCACDFWIQYAQNECYKQELMKHLPLVVEKLLKLMVYSDLDLLDIEDTISNDCFTQYQMNNHPYHKHTNTTPIRDDLSDLEEEDSDTDDPKDDQSEAFQDNDDDDDFDDDDFYSEDSLRKCSAAALDVLSVAYEDAMTHVVLTHLNHILVNEDWLIRESGILALGAIAEGGIHVLGQHLHKLVPYLLHSIKDNKPLVRSISCWAISRFSHWLVEQYDSNEQGRKSFFEPVLSALLFRLLDTNKRVQESACTAFIILGESASFRLVPYIQPILTHINNAFDLYRRKNLLILYDALATLASAVGSHLNQPQFIYLLMPPLIKKWNELSDKDADLFPLLQCLSNITAALGPGFIQYVDPVLSRCVKLISSTLQEQMLADKYPDQIIPPNVDFLIAALDLLSGVVQGLGPKIEPLIAQTNPPLLVLLKKCIHDPVSEVLRSTFALIGDIANASFDSLVPFLHELVLELIHVLHYRDCTMSVSVYNNALWALGTIAMRWGQDAEPYIPGLVQVFVPFLTRPQAPASNHENAMVALGRLGLASPHYVASCLRLFVKPWLEKSLSVRDGDEKDSAFRGLCAMIRLNAQDAHDELYLLLVAISTLQTPSTALKKDLCDILHMFRNKDIWEKTFSQLSVEAQSTISQSLAI